MRQLVLIYASLPLLTKAFLAPKLVVVPTSFAGRYPLQGNLNDVSESDSENVVQQFDSYMEKVEAAFQRVQKKMGKMKLKEKRSQEVLQAIEERMKSQETELTNKLEYKELEVQNVRIEAERERQAVIDQHRAREERLEFEMQNLLSQLDMERQNMETNKAMVVGTLAKKTELDAELAKLKVQYQKEAEKANSLSHKYRSEQQARMMEVAEAQRKADALREVADKLAQDSEKRIGELQQELLIKEKEKVEAVQAVLHETKAREQSLLNEIQQLNYNLEQNQQKLLGEISELNSRLQIENEKIRANENLNQRLEGEKSKLEMELKVLEEKYGKEVNAWAGKYEKEKEARHIEVEKAVQELSDLKVRTATALEESEKLKATLAEQLANKEKQKNAVILEMKEQLKLKENEFKAVTNDLGQQITKAKIQANQREITIAEELKAKDREQAKIVLEVERQLKNEIQELQDKIREGENSLAINKDLTNRILQQRVEIDAELGRLKLIYDQDKKKWDNKYARQQEIRRLEASRAKLNLENLQAMAEAALAEASSRQECLMQDLQKKEKEFEAKEKQNLANVMSLRDQMRSKENNLKAAIGDIGTELTRTKIEANLREIELKAKAKDDAKKLLKDAHEREIQLQQEIDHLNQLMKREEESKAINQDMTNRILQQRIILDAELGSMKKKYDADSKSWDLRFSKEQEAQRQYIVKAQEEMQSLQASFEDAMRHAEERQSRLKDELAMKEKQKHFAVMEIKREMAAKEKNLKEAINDIGIDMTQAKINANRRELDFVVTLHNKEKSLLLEAQARESELQKEIDGLKGLLQGQKEAQTINQELTNRILQRRIELDAELGALQKRYELESRNWDYKFAQEQEARRMAVQKAQEEMVALQSNFEAALEIAKDQQNSLKEQLEKKEQEKLVAITAVREEMKAKEERLKDKINEMGTELTNVKIDANKRSIMSKEEFKVREAQLLWHSRDLEAQLKAEQSQKLVNEKLTQSIVASRMALEADLGALKRRYEEDQKRVNDEKEIEMAKIEKLGKDLEEKEVIDSHVRKFLNERRLDDVLKALDEE